jgi:hypothetical protein
MPDTKITALTALTTADPANDMMPIVDVSDTSMAASGTTKRISINNILACSPSATLASATITGDLTVDTSTLKVDSTNDRVGFGTASPAQGVHLSKSSTSTALTSPPVGGASFRIQNTSSTNNNFGSVEFYNAAGLFGASVNCQYTNQATPTSDLVFVTRGSGGGLEHYRIAADGVATWSEVGGVAGTAMTLNSTGLGVGGSAITTNFEAIATSSGSIGGTATVSNIAASAAGNAASFNFRTNSNFRSSGYSSARIEAVTPAATNNTDLVFYNFKGVTISGDETMRITSAGNVGVGVTTPSYRLQSAVASGADGNIFAAQVTGASNGFQVLWNHATTTTRVIIANIPTSSAGLAAGTLWNDAGTIKIA